jgi:hypothetical protein
MSERIPAITATREVSHEFLAGIIITAVEGSINYWADITEYESEGHEDDGRNIYAKVQERTEDDEVSQVPQLLDTFAVAKGIERILTCQVPIADYIVGYIWQGLSNEDAGCIDAEAADCIVQAAILNELRYG